MSYFEINITDKSLPMINAIRRTILTDLESFCLNGNIKKNTTKFNNDILNHRLSLIPIKNDVEIKLDIENTTNEIKYVTSSEFLFIKGKKTDLMQDVLFCILEPKEHLIFTAKSVRGTARQHAKWQQANSYYYKTEDGYKLTVDSCFIDAKLIYNNAIEYLKQKLNRYKNLIKENKVLPSYNKIMNCATYTFENENHTLGNMLAYELRRHSDVSFAAYKVPHVLDNHIVLNIKTNSDVNKILSEIVDKVLQDI